LPNTVEVFIRTLRKKLHDENGELIETVRGFGYRLQA
jgi:DNA-binding response OmpR family regulator